MNTQARSAFSRYATVFILVGLLFTISPTNAAPLISAPGALAINRHISPPAYRPINLGPSQVASPGQLASSWFAVDSPVDYNLTSVAMAGANDGWAVGYHYLAAGWDPTGLIILRWDGGIWYPWWDSDAALPLYTLALASPTQGWTAGKSLNWMYHWDGSDWNSVATPATRTLRSISLVSETNGWAVGGSGLCQSGGIDATLIRLNGPDWELWGELNDRVLHSVDMVTENDGWAVGEYCHFVSPPADVNSVILHWNGSNWSSWSSPTYQTLYAVDMVTATDGWAVGGAGAILHWDGASWSEVSSPTDCYLYSVSMISATDGWAVGGDGYGCSSPSSSTIIHWDGNAWSEVSSPVDAPLKSVTMLSADEGWAVGENGTILRYTAPEKLVRVIGVWTADYDWNEKYVFNPGDPIRYIISIQNDTGADAQIQLTYYAQGPAGQTVFYDQYTDTIPAGLWQWADDWTVPEDMGGTHTLTGTGLYLGTTTQASGTYTVTGSTGMEHLYLPLITR